MGISGVPRRQDAQSERQSHRLLQLPQAAGHAGLCVLLSEHEDRDSVARTACLCVSAANPPAALTLRRILLSLESSQYCPALNLDLFGTDAKGPRSLDGPTPNRNEDPWHTIC